MDDEEWGKDAATYGLWWMLWQCKGWESRVHRMKGEPNPCFVSALLLLLLLWWWGRGRKFCQPCNIHLSPSSNSDSQQQRIWWLKAHNERDCDCDLEMLLSIGTIANSFMFHVVITLPFCTARCRVDRKPTTAWNSYTYSSLNCGRPSHGSTNHPTDQPTDMRRDTKESFNLDVIITVAYAFMHVREEVYDASMSFVVDRAYLSIINI